MIILGFVGFLLGRKVKWFEKINIYGMFGFLFLGIFIGGTTLFYYSLPLSLFAIFGFGFSTWLLGIEDNKKTEKLIGALIVLFGFILNILNATKVIE